jgi:exonuclease III
MEFSGPKFTWTNKQDAQSNVRVKLDRAIANQEFAMKFEDANVENIITTSSDHYAILIRLEAGGAGLHSPSVQQTFRYEAMWR